jgi:hypothetical protein
MHMPLPMQTLPNRIRLRSRRKALSTSLRGRLENVSEGATNQRCPLGSAGHVDCQKLFVCDMAAFSPTVVCCGAHSMAVGAIFEIGASVGLLLTVRTGYRTRPAGGERWSTRRRSPTFRRRGAYVICMVLDGWVSAGRIRSTTNTSSEFASNSIRIWSPTVTQSLIQ